MKMMLVIDLHSEADGIDSNGVCDVCYLFLMKILESYEVESMLGALLIHYGIKSTLACQWR
jgi:hypothetical protein